MGFMYGKIAHGITPGRDGAIRVRPAGARLRNHGESPLVARYQPCCSSIG